MGVSGQRYALLGLVLVLVASFGGGALGATTLSVVGRPLPPDAAPADQQVLTGLTQPATTLDFFVSVYKRPQNVDGNSWSDDLSAPLVRLDKNFNLIPAAATSWDVSADGQTWTFHLDRAQVWSDGAPVTADDFVATFRLGADPKYAWDFAWFFSAIKGWDEAVKGTIPVTEIGVQRGADPYTLVVTTKAPAPYLPGMMVYSPPLNARALAQYGPFYNTDPKTSVSSGPYVLQEWTKDQRIVLVANPTYRGVRPYIQRVVLKFADLQTEFPAYLANEVDVAANFSPADLEVIEKDPGMRAQYHQGFGDFRTYYLGVDTMNAPFNNLKVRQAFSHAIDREGLVKAVIKRQGIAAYGFLMPGFPGSHQDDLKGIQSFDPAVAKKLLADAGFPNGVEITLNGPQGRYVRDKEVAEAAAGQLNKAGIKTALRTYEFVNYLNNMVYVHKAGPVWLIGWGTPTMDAETVYVPLFRSGNIFVNWHNDDFNGMIDEAQTIMDEKKRLAQYHRINKLWVEEMPAIPLYQQIDLYGANKRLSWKARSDELIKAYDMALKDGK